MEKPVWQYGYGAYDAAKERVTRFTLFTTHTENTWQAGPKIPDPGVGYAMLSAQGGHPGNRPEYAVIRRWTAPMNATLTIHGTLNHPADQGDGVQARVVSSRDGLLGSWTAFHGTAETHVENVHVRRGDTLDFIVDCRANDGFDSFAWAPVLHTVKPDGPTTAALHSSTTGEWNAETDFDTQPAVARATLDRWERYIQTLFMTNEFNFID